MIDKKKVRVSKEVEGARLILEAALSYFLMVSKEAILKQTAANPEERMYRAGILDARRHAAELHSRVLSDIREITG